ncbi:MAG: LysR family transcriptional regulator [Myxococcota bacterium]
MSLPVFEPPHLEDVRLLCAVVERGSFSAAAKHTGTTQPRVSRAIARLEERLGIPLVRRSSRGIAVTPEGERYAALGRRLLADMQTLEAELASQKADAGPLRVSAPPALARRLLVPHLASFCQQHPEIRLELSLGARRVDLIDEDVDVAIRFGPLEETWRRSRRLLAGCYHVYAAPSLGLEPLRHPDELANWPALVLHATHLRDRWPLRLGREVEFFPVHPSLLADDVDALVGFAVAGAGVTILPDFLVQTEVAHQRLVRLTTEEQAAPAEVFAITTTSPERASRLVAHLATHLRPGPRETERKPATR